MDLDKIVKYVRRKYQTQPKRRKQVEYLLHHANQMYHKLTAKRISLSHGIHSLHKCSNDMIISVSDLLTGKDDHNISAIIQSMLQHWFIQYLRLRDGFVLLQSGECRHVPDQRMSESTSFRSRLTYNKGRADGYTTLFSASHYSGFGWDEFYDEENGIKSRFCQLLLHRKSRGDANEVWENWLDRFPTLSAFETKLDHHETKMRQLIDELEISRKNFLRKVEETISDLTQSKKEKKIQMSTKDKFECLQISILNRNGQELFIKIERQGNNFRINDSDGVLPKDWTQKDWENQMKWDNPKATSQSKSQYVGRERKGLKRRVIDESSEDSEEDQIQIISKTSSQAANNSKSLLKSSKIQKVKVHDNVKLLPQKSDPGLKIEVKTNANDSLSNKKVSDSDILSGQPIGTTSLSAIKMDFGVNDISLQSSRQFLENEQRETANEVVKDFISNELEKPIFLGLKDYDENLGDLMEEIAISKEDFMLHKQNYKNMTQHKTRKLVDYSEEWDIRECLRESSMHLGNLYLNLFKVLGTSLRSHDSESFLNKAHLKFKNAIKMIQEQKLANKINLNTSELHSQLKRNLLLLEGRASSNLAITFIEKVDVEKRRKSNVPIPNVLNVAESRQILLQNSLTHLEKAEECSRSLFSLLAIARSQGKYSNLEDYEFEKVDCLQMKYIAIRWHAIALWEMKKIEKAFAMLEKYASAGENCESDELNIPASPSSIYTFVEKYLCAMLIIELTTNIYKVDPRKARQKLADSIQWYRKAASMSDAIKKVTNRDHCSIAFTDLKQEYGIEDSTKLLQEAEYANESLKINEKDSNINVEIIQRNDSFQHKWATGYSFLPQNNPPTGQINISSLSRHKRKNDSARHNNRDTTVGSQFSSENLAQSNFAATTFDCDNKDNTFSSRSNSVPTIKYRKWGDELLPQTINANGVSCVKLDYPACAPEKPSSL